MVTGASKGIGRAIAIELAKNKINVVVNYNKDEKEAVNVVEEIKKLGSDAIAVKADVSDFGQCSAMMEIVKKKFNSLDILVNNAGILSDKTFEKMTKEQWDLVINTNLNSMFNVTKNALPLLKDNGRIINISSVIGINGNFGQTNYAASKAGIIGFTKSLAKELGRRNITVNAVAPGLIETQMTKNISFVRKKVIMEVTPLKRFGMPEDVANLVVFLASERASYITGEVVCVDGGLNF